MNTWLNHTWKCAKAARSLIGRTKWLGKCCMKVKNEDDPVSKRSVLISTFHKKGYIFISSVASRAFGVGSFVCHNMFRHPTTRKPFSHHCSAGPGWLYDMYSIPPSIRNNVSSINCESPTWKHHTCYQNPEPRRDASQTFSWTSFTPKLSDYSVSLGERYS